MSARIENVSARQEHILRCIQEIGEVSIDTLCAEFDASTATIRRKVVIADHSKSGSVSRWLLCPADEVQTIITDGKATEESIAPFRDKGVEIIRT